jgi:hypothetical protein
LRIASLECISTGLLKARAWLGKLALTVSGVALLIAG